MENLIGIESHVQKLKSLLDMESDDVRIIGIWGMGGIGKTTIARALFRQIFYYFEGSSFVENVREKASNDSGLTSLQEEVLKEILMMKNLKVRSVDEGTDMMSTRLCHKRVLLVLDDVNDVKQLEALAAAHDWFGTKSRIIITTRDMHLLSGYEVNCVYEPGLLDKDRSIQLFSRYAFKTNSPVEGYEELSQRAVRYASCLPLALKVLGSYLRGRDKMIWGSALNRLAVLPEDRIHKVLKLSYDGLSDIEKEIFLDIACFFKSWKMEFVTRILDSFDFHPEIGLSVLIEKSLLTVSKGRLHMHDLIQEMGWHIARGLLLADPGRSYSRLWRAQDIPDVLTTNIAGEAIQGIMLDTSQEVNLNAQVFTSTKKLRLLLISDKSFLRSRDVFSYKPTYLPDDLRCLSWNRYPFGSLPAGFGKLVRLEMPNCQSSQLWNGLKILDKLKVIRLYGSHNLRRFPDVTGAPNIERLILHDCRRLLEVHPSVGALKRLVFLNLRNCYRLKTLPPSIKMESLETLILSNCRRLKRFPDIPFKMGRLSKIFLQSSGIEEIPSTIGHLTGLVLLNLRKCESLKSLPSTICDLKHLKTIKLSYCRRLEKLPNNIGSMKSLEELLLNKSGIKELPFKIILLKNLRRLSFWNFDEQPFSRLFVSSLRSLTRLNLKFANFLEKEIPYGFIALSSLTELDLSNSNIVCIPASICQFSQLKVLKLVACESLEELQELPSSLQVLSAYGCTSLEKLKDLSLNNKWLYKISLGNCHKLLENQERNNSVADMLLQSLLQGHAVTNHRFTFNIPGTEIPDWFRQQDISLRREKILMKLPPNWHKEILGFAICFVLPYMPNISHVCMGFRITKETEYTENVDIDPSLSAVLENEGAHLWISYISFDFVQLIFSNDFQPEDWSQVEGYLSIRIGERVVKCGARIVYKADVEWNTMIVGPHIFEYGTLDPCLLDYEYDDETEIKPLYGCYNTETAYLNEKGFYRGVMFDI